MIAVLQYLAPIIIMFLIAIQKESEQVKDYPWIETQVNSALGHINATFVVPVAVVTAVVDVDNPASIPWLAGSTLPAVPPACSVWPGVKKLVLIWQGGNYYWIALSSHRGLRLLPTNDRNVTSTNMFQERIDSQRTLWQTCFCTYRNIQI